jgi:hypothetical protein
MRRYPRNSGPAALPLFCLAPHGVFPASRIAPQAVSSYLAFSPLPVPLLPKNRRCLFCDTFRRRDFTIAAPAFFTRHVAVWCSDFPPASVAAYQRSSAIAINLTQSGTQKSRNKTSLWSFPGFLVSLFVPNSKWRRHGQEENRYHREGDDQFAHHCAEASQQTPPACPAGIDHSLAGNEFAQDGTNYRSDE